jgi:predicted kinase
MSANTVVLWGPPCSGKTTYIAERIQPGDVRVDLDAIALALAPAGTRDHGTQDWHIRLAMDARVAVLDNLRKVPAHVTCWVIDSNADHVRRLAWRKQGAHVVELEVDYAECVRRAQAAGRPAEVVDRLIPRWFARHRSDQVPDALRPRTSGLASRQW